MHEIKDKKELLDLVIEIEVRVEKAQTLIKAIKSFIDMEDDETTLLDIINDYHKQILLFTGELSDGIRGFL